MNPEKLFDYLEGNLPAAEAAKFEERLARDPQLQRELEIAREMHRRSPGSREILGVDENDVEIPQPSGKLGRRVATAFIALVAANVAVGLAFIIGSNKPKAADLQAKERAIRQQISESLEKTAESTLPLPTLDVDEVHLPGSSSERETIADSVVALATQHGGSAKKAPADETGITVLAELPANRADEFRQALTPFAPTRPSAPKAKTSTRPASEMINIYVRISETPPPEHP